MNWFKKLLSRTKRIVPVSKVKLPPTGSAIISAIRNREKLGLNKEDVVYAALDRAIKELTDSVLKDLVSLDLYERGSHSGITSLVDPDERVAFTLAMHEWVRHLHVSSNGIVEKDAYETIVRKIVEETVIENCKEPMRAQGIEIENVYLFFYARAVVYPKAKWSLRYAPILPTGIRALLDAHPEPSETGVEVEVESFECHGVTQATNSEFKLLNYLIKSVTDVLIETDVKNLRIEGEGDLGRTVTVDSIVNRIKPQDHILIAGSQYPGNSQHPLTAVFDYDRVLNLKKDTVYKLNVTIGNITYLINFVISSIQRADRMKGLVRFTQFDFKR